MQRSEILEPKEREDDISRSLMMMWSVALTGSKPCQVLSEEAMRALADLHSSRKNIEKIETVLGSEPVFFHFKNLDDYHLLGNGLLPVAWKDARTKERFNILKRVICLLKDKLFGT